MTLQLTELTWAGVQPGSGTGRKGGNGQVVFQDGYQRRDLPGRKAPPWEGRAAKHHRAAISPTISHNFINQ